MPKVVIKKDSNLDAQTVYNKVKSFLENDGDLKKLDSGYKCEFQDAALTGKATGKLFKAEMKVQKSVSGSQVEIIVDLPLTLALAKSMIEKTLNNKLDRSLNA